MEAGRSFHWLIALCERKVLRIAVSDFFLYILMLCPLVTLSFSLTKTFGSMSTCHLKILNVEIVSLESVYIEVLVGQGCVNDSHILILKVFFC